MKHATRRVAVLKALRDLIDAELAEARTEAAHALIDAHADMGVKSLTIDLPDGTKVATATLTDPKPVVRVDDVAFLEWVTAQHPGELVYTVRPAFRKAAVEALTPAGDKVVNGDGEVVDWATTHQPQPTLSVRFTTDGRDAIAAAWAENRLGELTPGPKQISG